jgi:hypothetical protein
MMASDDRNPTAKQIKNIEEKAAKVLETRATFPKAHNELDRAV